MAKFSVELPIDLIHDFQYLSDNTDQILGEMVQAGAETAMANIKSNIPKGFIGSKIMDCLKITKIYKTPSDGGINCKVAFYGYFDNQKGERVPAPLVVNVMEFGRSDGSIKKHPFIRKAFKKANIEESMHSYGEAYIRKALINKGFTP